MRRSILLHNGVQNRESRKTLDVVMGKVIQQRHIAAMVLGKFIQGEKSSFFIVTTTKWGGERRGKEKLEREREKLCSFVYQRGMYRLSTCWLFIS
jgi:hypothetical protein